MTNTYSHDSFSTAVNPVCGAKEFCKESIDPNAPAPSSHKCGQCDLYHHPSCAGNSEPLEQLGREYICAGPNCLKGDYLNIFVPLNPRAISTGPNNQNAATALLHLPLSNKNAHTSTGTHTNSDNESLMSPCHSPSGASFRHTKLTCNGEDFFINHGLIRRDLLNKGKCGTFSNPPNKCLFKSVMHNAGAAVGEDDDSNLCAVIVQCSNLSCQRRFHFGCYHSFINTDDSVAAHVTTIQDDVLVVKPVCGKQCLKIVRKQLLETPKVSSTPGKNKAVSAPYWKAQTKTGITSEDALIEWMTIENNLNRFFGGKNVTSNTSDGESKSAVLNVIKDHINAASGMCTNGIMIS